MTKVLIAYATRLGATKDTANVIAEVLRDKYSHEVDVYNVRDKINIPNLDDFDTIIVGSSVMRFMWVGDAKKFLRNNFEGKNLAVFVTSGALAASAEDKGDMKTYRKWEHRFIDRIVSRRTKVKLFAKRAFGGRWSYGDKHYDNWNKEKIISWAELIGDYLESAEKEQEVPEMEM